MFNKIKRIGTKLGLAFGFILVLLLAAGFFSAFQYFFSMHEYKKYAAGRIDQLKAVYTLNSHLKDQTQAWKNILLRGTSPLDFTNDKNEFDHLNSDILKDIVDLRISKYRFVTKENLDTLNELENAYVAAQDAYQEAIKAYQKTFDYKAADVELRGIDVPISLLAEKMLVSSIVHTTAQSEKISKAVEQKVIVVMVILIVVAIIGTIFAILISRDITEPIISLNKAANLIAQGDLGGIIKSQGCDEVGQLGETFILMVKNLNEILHKTIAAVTQITVASSEILSASQQQVVGAREQSSAINQTTSAATELSKSAEQVGENIKRVSSIANHVLAGMIKIKFAIGKTGEQITSLSDKSLQIGKITDLINDVADQTNLLAVNAAIEAARAGEEGRGFAVVADEIRKLADSTSKSTKDITALIEIIQHEMSNAIISMEQSVNNVSEESKLAEESADSAKEISMSATQQVSGSKQIADAMGNINDSMKQISAGAIQAQSEAKQLAQLASELKTITTKFKLA